MTTGQGLVRILWTCIVPSFNHVSLKEGTHKISKENQGWRLRSKRITTFSRYFGVGVVVRYRYHHHRKKTQEMLEYKALKTTTRPNNCIFTPPCSITQGASRALICTSRNTTSCAVSLINVGLLYLGERIYLQTTCIQRKADALWPNICYKQTLLGNVLKYIACIYIDVYTF